jgi:hypothetical protein
MLPGKIMVEWEADGRLHIKTSLPMNATDGKRMAVRVLLDAAKAINDTGSSLIDMPVGLAPSRILGGAN